MPLLFSTAGRIVRCGPTFFGRPDAVMLRTTYFRRVTAASWPPSCRKWMPQKAGVIFSGLRRIFCGIVGVAGTFRRRLTRRSHPAKMILKRGQMCVALLRDYRRVSVHFFGLPTSKVLTTERLLAAP